MPTRTIRQTVIVDDVEYDCEWVLQPVEPGINPSISTYIWNHGVTDPKILDKLNAIGWTAFEREQDFRDDGKDEK